MPDTNVPSVADRLAEILGFLPEGLSVDSWSQRVLEGIFEPFAKVDRYLALRRERLVDLADPDAIPLDLARFLAQDVGLGPDLSAVPSLTPSDLRKLTASAVRIWKTKGTTPSVRTTIAALTGSRSLLLGWFELRWTTDRARAVTVLPGIGFGNAPYANPERVTDAWYMDPDPTGSVDVDALVRFLEVVRLTGERVNLRPALLLDDLLQGEGFWTRFGSGGSHGYRELAAGGYELHVAGDDGFFADLDGESAAWTEYLATYWFDTGGTVPSVSAWVFLTVEGDLDNGYRVDLDVHAGELRIYRVHAGASTLLTSIAGLGLAAGYPYALGLNPADGTLATTLQVYLEGNLVASVVDSNANRKRAGGVAWSGEGASSEAALRHALIYAPGVSNTRIGPNP